MAEYGKVRMRVDTQNEERRRYLSGDSVGRSDREPQNPLNLASLVGVTQEIKRPSIHSGEVLAVFVRAGGSGDDDDGYLRTLPSCQFDQLLVSAILKAKATKTDGDITSSKEVVRSPDPIDAFNFDAMITENLRQGCSHFQVIRGNYYSRGRVPHRNARRQEGPRQNRFGADSR